MTDLPHVIAGQLGISEEHTRVVEAWWREHNDGPPPLRWTASMYNAAVDWANALGAQPVGDEPPPDAPVYQMPDGGTMWGTWEADEDDQLAEAVAQAWNYDDTGDEDAP